MFELFNGSQAGGSKSISMQLTYFNLRGRAEPIRLTLLAANVDFEDNRIYSNEWPALKSTVPGGKVPILEVTQGGATKVYTESMAIARLFAKKHHMMGSTDEEYYEIERVIGQCTDIDMELFPAFRASDEEKLKIAQTFRGEAGPRLLTLMCQHLDSSPSGLVAGNTLSLGDLVILCTTDQVEVVVPGFISEKFPTIQKHRELVLKKCPKLVEYLKTRGSFPL
ncbi:unnamed protein product [Dicrocoelium dendriticum]|nr:unnamed protein product [Dicrocoelium dendriticum]